MHGAVDRATNSTAFENAARVGYSVSGVLHLLIAYIVVRLAFGSGGNADQSGALATLAAQPGGAVALWVTAVGLAALALWRLAESVVGSHPNRAGPARRRCEEGVQTGQIRFTGAGLLRYRADRSALRHRRRQVERRAECRPDRPTSPIRLGEGTFARLRCGDHCGRWLSRLQRSVEEVREGPEGVRRNAGDHAGHDRLHRQGTRTRRCGRPSRHRHVHRRPRQRCWGWTPP